MLGEKSLRNGYDYMVDRGGDDTFTGWRHILVVTFTAIRLRGPGFKPRPEQQFENEKISASDAPQRW